MTILEFISKVIESISWPIAILIAVLVLKSPITELLTRIRKLKQKDIQLEFDEFLKDAEEQTQELNEVSTGDSETLQQIIKKAKALLDVDPNSAIVYIWLELESAIDHTISKIHSDITAYTSMRKKIDLLAQKELIDYRWLKHLDLLKQLCNRAVHKYENQVTITYSQGQLYIEMARRIYRKLENS